MKTVVAVLAAAVVLASTALGNAVWVQGFVPDWNQPYTYVGLNGPGPEPAGG